MSDISDIGTFHKHQWLSQYTCSALLTILKNYGRAFKLTYFTFSNFWNCLKATGDQLN